MARPAWHAGKKRGRGGQNTCCHGCSYADGEEGLMQFDCQVGTHPMRDANEEHHDCGKQ
jgi:hypothetical protein